MMSGFAAALQLTYLLGSLTIQSYICQPPAAPDILSPADQSVVTDGVAFTVSGQGEHQSTIIISEDTTALVSVQADSSNHFSANVTVQGVGEHTLNVKAARPCGTTQGNQITVIAEANTTPVDPTDPTEPTNPTTPVTPGTPSTGGEPASPNYPDGETPLPDTDSDNQGTSKGLKLTVTDPLNESSTTDSSVFLKATTSRDATLAVFIDGEEVGTTYLPRTEFGLSVPLKVGLNEIYVKAQGKDGSATVKLTVTRYAQQSPSYDGTTWAQSEAGRTTIRVVAISIVTILLLVVIIGLIFL